MHLSISSVFPLTAALNLLPSCTISRPPNVIELVRALLGIPPIP